VGARTRKAGHTKFYVGYKKHTLRLWLRAHSASVILIPLSSWTAPAHLPEGYLLKPSIDQCQRRLNWVPDIVVGDLAYIRQEIKREIRQRWKVAVVTRMKPDMNIIEPFDYWNRLSCQHSQPLEWLGYDASDQHHWFGPKQGRRLCPECWDASQCPKEFSYPAASHETLLGLLPLNTRAANQLLNQVRSWVEPAQAYEKNLLGLKHMFLNSLRLSWTVSLLADSVVLLRALASMNKPQPASHPLHALLPQQLDWNFKNLNRPEERSI